ncbi:MAG TPA: alpha,alpha-trehalase TreF [Steroidobacteraceae bacterium]|jgi:alpha,alpha-trehalase|nr:alpha,alpha-trehalase TreF [Steroidobacteraceae bacterium]
MPELQLHGRERVTRFRAALVGLLGSLVVVAASVARDTSAWPPTPSQLFGELYTRVQAEHLFADSKTFADATPRRSPETILSAYRAKPPRTNDELRAFVRANFVIPGAVATPLPAAVRDRKASMTEHIAALWPYLTRSGSFPEPGSSLLPLYRPYVVPGGRFREMYYWDSYFTMLGLARDGHHDLVLDMTRNFADLIGRYGHVPNGTRTYYLSRSQPPFFFAMVGLTDEKNQAAAYAKYLPALRTEHAFWMHGEQGLQPGQAVEHVVALPDGAILNRYWDAADTPRDESYREDAALAAKSSRPAAELYRDLRSAAESGWDFSSRWFADGRSLETIETTAIVPVDLNSLLFGLERAIAMGCREVRDASCVSEFERRATERRAAIQRYLWDAAHGRFLDYQWQRRQQLDRPTVAMLYPLFVGFANPEQARAVAAVVSQVLLAPGGVLTTPERTGQQWDAPNGWAPHQWIAVVGLNNYGQTDLARTIATRWIETVSRTYRETGKLLEKYDVQEARPGGGGEYPLQDGFGWTNGVTRAFLDLYPTSLYSRASTAGATASAAAAAVASRAAPR